MARANTGDFNGWFVFERRETVDHIGQGRARDQARGEQNNRDPPCVLTNVQLATMAKIHGEFLCDSRKIVRGLRATGDFD